MVKVELKKSGVVLYQIFDLNLLVVGREGLDITDNPCWFAQFDLEKTYRKEMKVRVVEIC